MAQVNHRTINIDALDPESSVNFDLATLLPPGILAVSAAEVQSLIAQIRQLLRGGDAAGALLSALEAVPYGADAHSKDAYAQVVTEILQSIRQAEMTPLLTQIYAANSEHLDVLMKFIYKGMGMSYAGTGAAAAAAAAASPQQANGPAAPGFSQMAGRSFSGSAGSQAGAEAGGQVMSVLLSWHERCVEIAGLGCIVRVMADRRRV